MDVTESEYIAAILALNGYSTEFQPEMEAKLKQFQVPDRKKKPLLTVSRPRSASFPAGQFLADFVVLFLSISDVVTCIQQQHSAEASILVVFFARVAL